MKSNHVAMKQKRVLNKKENNVAGSSRTIEGNEQEKRRKVFSRN